MTKRKKTGLEILQPPSQLSERAEVSGSGDIDMSAIKKAEQALEDISGDFEGWILEEIETLKAARRDDAAHGADGERRGRLFNAAHDLKGHGATFGYPLVTDVAGSLCKLLEAGGDAADIPQNLIDAHVEAIGAIVREQAREKRHPTGLALAERLLDMVQDFVAAHHAASDESEDKSPEAGKPETG